MLLQCLLLQNLGPLKARKQVVKCFLVVPILWYFSLIYDSSKYLLSLYRPPSTEVTTIDAFKVTSRRKLNVWEQAVEELEPPAFQKSFVPCIPLEREERSQLETGWRLHRPRTSDVRRDPASKPVSPASRPRSMLAMTTANKQQRRDVLKALVDARSTPAPVTPTTAPPRPPESGAPPRPPEGEAPTWLFITQICEELEAVDSNVTHAHWVLD